MSYVRREVPIIILGVSRCRSQQIWAVNFVFTRKKTTYGLINFDRYLCVTVPKMLIISANSLWLVTTERAVEFSTLPAAPTVTGTTNSHLFRASKPRAVTFIQGRHCWFIFTLLTALTRHLWPRPTNSRPQKLNWRIMLHGGCHVIE